MVHNEEDRAFVVSNESMARMLIHNQWIAREAPKRGLRDPWKYRPDRILDMQEVMTEIAGAQIKGTKSIYRDYTEEEMAAWKIERDEYMRQRDEWVALQVFHKFGYEAFLAECETCGLTNEFRNSIFPCESRHDPQCSMYCVIFKDCALRLVETREGDEIG